MARILGNPIRESVVQELERRKTLLASEKTGYGQNELLYLHSNTGWCRAISGVVDSSNNLSYQKYILGGGTLSYNSSGNPKREQYNLNGIGNNTYSTYKDINSLGFRPMPGITSFQVENAGTNGILKTANVAFKAYTLEDLNILEPLFLRPGFTVILEWGHSMYYDNNKTLISDPSPLPLSEVVAKSPDIQNIESKIKNKRSQSNYNYDGMVGIVKNFSYAVDIDGSYICNMDLISRGQVMESLKINAPGAYKKSDTTFTEPEEDVFAGPTPNADRLREIINSNDSTTEKGNELSNGGDITPLMADIGIELINHLNTEVPEAFFEFTGGNDFYHQTQTNYGSKHISGQALDLKLAGLYSDAVFRKTVAAIESFANSKGNLKFINEYSNPSSASTAPHFHLALTGADANPTDSVEASTPKERVDKIVEGITKKYTPLAAVLATIKSEWMEERLKRIIFREEDFQPMQQVLEELNIKFTLKQEEEDRVVDGTYLKKEDRTRRYINMSFFLRMIHQLHLVDYIKDGKGKPLFSLNYNKYGNKYNTYANHIFPDPYMAVLPKRPEDVNRYIDNQRMRIYEPLRKNNPDDILNIMLDVDFLLSKLKVASDQNGSIFDYIESVLDSLNSKLAGVNNFRLHLDDEESVYYVVDGKDIPVDKKLPVIDLTGLKSTVSNFSLFSKIPSALNSMIAITAQSSPSDFGEEGSVLFNFNKGLKDRFKPEVRMKGYDKTNTIDPYEKSLEMLRLHCLSFGLGDRVEYDQIKDIQNHYITVTQREYLDKVSTPKNPPPGILPFELKFTTLGISGLIIGDTFKINKGLLPEKYENKLGFIVFGLNNRIEDNRWITEITGNPIILKG